MIEAAQRLQTVEEYYFSKKLREVRLLQANGKPIINLGIGSPDLQPPNKVITALNESFKDVEANQYQSYQGLPELRKAMTDFYSYHYQVDLNPASEVLPLMGSKEGILHISMAFLNPGDQVLIPNPGYPTYRSVSDMLGAESILYELSEEANWLPDLAALEKEDLSRVKIMWVNYPHMPTGASATEQLFRDLVEFGRKHNILIVNDNPYSFILNDNQLSILAVPGAMEVALELNSLSKTFNMSGWRVGMLCGSEEHLKTELKVKSNMDSGMFYPLQVGAIAALKLSKTWFRTQNEIYENRKKKILALAEALNCVPSKDQ